METTQTHEFMSDEWLAAVRDVFESRATKVSAAAGPEPLTVQELYTARGSGRLLTGWHCTFAGGRVADFGRGQTAEADLSSTSPWHVARRLAATILDDDADAITAYTAEHATHVHRTVTCDLQRVQGLAAALADAHDAIARVTSPSPGQAATEWSG